MLSIPCGEFRLRTRVVGNLGSGQKAGPLKRTLAEIDLRGPDKFHPVSLGGGSSGTTRLTG